MDNQEAIKNKDKRYVLVGMLDNKSNVSYSDQREEAYQMAAFLLMDGCKVCLIDRYTHHVTELVLEEK